VETVGSVLLAIVVIAAVIWFKVVVPRKKKAEFDKKSAELEKAFLDAKREKNKAKALEAGRAYYSHLRGGSLTIYDETSLNNDLNAM